MTYGITPEGFNRKPESVIVDGFELRQRAKVAADLDVSAESVVGQFNGIFGRELGICWELLEVCSRATDPEQAEDDLLEQVCKLSGTERRGADYSRVTVQCALTSGTVLEPEVAQAAVDGDPTSLWTPEETFTAESGGTHAVTFRALVAGPVHAVAGTITVLHAPVVGWTSVTNPADAEPGRAIDSDATLRLRREQQLANAGSATARAIRAAVLDIPEVQFCRVFENETNVTDENGMPPHSIEVLIFDGVVASADDAKVAQAVLDNKAGGIRTVGGVTATATDAHDEERSVSFSRATQRPIYLTYGLSTLAGYVGDAAVKTHVVERASALYGLGQGVRARQLDSVVFGLAGVDDVLSFALGFAASPVGTANLAIGAREIPVFDTSRVEIV